MTSRDDKITSVRIRKDIWKKAKIIAIEEGETLKSLIEGLLLSVIEGSELASGMELEIQEDALKVFRERRKRGLLPFKIISEKTAVELVREGKDC